MPTFRGAGAEDGWPLAHAAEASQPRPMLAEREVDVEVLVDDSWWPGYLNRRDWHETSGGRWVCFVRFNTWRSPEGPIEDEARHFDEDHIRSALGSPQTPMRGD
jgi:hypothetical protein